MSRQLVSVIGYRGVTVVGSSFSLTLLFNETKLSLCPFTMQSLLCQNDSINQSAVTNNYTDERDEATTSPEPSPPCGRAHSSVVSCLISVLTYELRFMCCWMVKVESVCHGLSGEGNACRSETQGNTINQHIHTMHIGHV